MKVTVELRTGPHHNPHVTKKDIEGNIEALQRLMDRKERCSDSTLVLDTISILRGIQNQLPET